MLKKLFAGLFGSAKSTGASHGAQSAEPVDYKGYLIISCPDGQSGQFRVSGIIRQPLDGGEVREHRFERSDILPGREACDAMMITKAQRFIDETGDAMFSPDPRRRDDDDTRA